MKKITNSELVSLSAEAKNSVRKRKNYNFHQELSDPFQRMLNAMEPGTYIQPHKHELPDKREVFIILKGKAVILTFTDLGDILNYFVLDPSTGNYGVEIPERVWHTIIVLESNTVFFEVKDGPYDELSDKNFALWAPKESEKTCTEYNNELLKQIKIG